MTARPHPFSSRSWRETDNLLCMALGEVGPEQSVDDECWDSWGSCGEANSRMFVEIIREERPALKPPASWLLSDSLGLSRGLLSIRVGNWFTSAYIRVDGFRELLIVFFFAVNSNSATLQVQRARTISCRTVLTYCSNQAAGNAWRAIMRSCTVTAIYISYPPWLVGIAAKLRDGISLLKMMVRFLWWLMVWTWKTKLGSLSVQ